MSKVAVSAFPEVEKIKYEGPKSTNPLAFRWYNPEEIVEGKTMKEHMRFTVCYWHTFRGTGGDPFGGGTMQRPWDDGTESVENACNRARVAFEFFEKTRRSLLRISRSRRCARRRLAGGIKCQPRCRRSRPQRRTRPQRCQAAVGHRQHVFQSALHAWSRHDLQSRRFHLRSSPGQEGDGSHP